MPVGGTLADAPDGEEQENINKNEMRNSFFSGVAGHDHIDTHLAIKVNTRDILGYGRIPLTVWFFGFRTQGASLLPVPDST